jgi:hypothetical protein
MPLPGLVSSNLIFFLILSCSKLLVRSLRLLLPLNSLKDGRELLLVSVLSFVTAVGAQIMVLIGFPASRNV